MNCCKKGAINLIRRYPHRFFIEFHRIFGFFVPNRLGFVEIYPKGVFNFFSNFFSRWKFDDKVGIFGFCDKFLNIYFVEFPEICKFRGKIALCSTYPGRKNPKSCRYRGEQGETKSPFSEKSIFGENFLKA